MSKSILGTNKTSQVNSFTGGLNTDLHPLLQPNDTLTDCLNGTLITYNGNENMLQNDMGNYELRNAKLPAGYIPMGMKEYQGILYMILMNPITRRVQIGSYPSPKTDFGSASEAEEYIIQPVEIGTVDTLKEFAKEWYAEFNNSENPITWVDSDGSIDNIDEIRIERYVDNNMHEIIWRLIDSSDTYLPYKTKLLRSKLDESLSSNIFTKDFDDTSMLTLGDNYLFSKTVDKLKDSEGNDTSDDETYELNPPFQSLKFFTTNKENEKFEIDDDDLYLCSDASIDSENITFDNVAWESNGWLGAQYEIESPKEIEQTVSGTVHGRAGVSFISEIRKPGNIDSREYNYEFTIKNLDTSDKIVDFEQFVEDNKNKLTILKGELPEVSFSTYIDPIITNISLENSLWKKYVHLRLVYANTPEYIAPGEGIVCQLSEVQSLMEKYSGVYSPHIWVLYGDIDLNAVSKLFNKSSYFVFISPDANIFGELTTMEYSIVYSPSNLTGATTMSDAEKTLIKTLCTKCADGKIAKFTSSDDETKLFGLSGTWDEKQYIPHASDSETELKYFLSEFSGAHIILPNTLKVGGAEVCPNNVYILPYDNEEELWFDIPNSEHNVYYNNPAIKVTRSYNSVDETSEKNKKIWEYQFSFDFKWNNESVKLSNANLSQNDDCVKLSLSVKDDEIPNIQECIDNVFNYKIDPKTVIGKYILYYKSQSKLQFDCGIFERSHIFEDNTGFGMVTFDEPPTSIYIKEGKSYLEEIILPDTIVNIGDNGFRDCTNLKRIVFPNHKVVLSQGSFWDCTNLKTIEAFSLELQDCVFNNVNRLLLRDSLILSAKSYSIEANLEKENLEIWTPKISTNWYSKIVTTECVKIYLSRSPYTEWSDKDLWNNHVDLWKNSIPGEGGDNIILIPPKEQVLKYTSVNDGACVTEADLKNHDYFQIWNEDESLHFISFKNSATTITGLFKSTPVDSISIPTCIKSLGDEFCDGTLLSAVEIPENVTTIGNCFNQCRDLTKITLGKNVSEINQNAFAGCVNGLILVIKGPYRAVKLPNASNAKFKIVRCYYSAKDWTFENNTGWTIEAYSDGFSNYENCIEAGSLGSIYLENVNYNGSLNEDDRYKCVTISNNNNKVVYRIYIMSDEGFSIGNSLQLSPIQGRNCKVVFPEGVWRFEDRTNNYPLLTSTYAKITVSLPTTLQYIGDYTFFRTHISNINIPQNVKFVGNRAFELSAEAESEKWVCSVWDFKSVDPSLKKAYGYNILVDNIFCTESAARQMRFPWGRKWSNVEYMPYLWVRYSDNDANNSWPGKNIIRCKMNSAEYWSNLVVEDLRDQEKITVYSNASVYIIENKYVPGSPNSTGVYTYEDIARFNYLFSPIQLHGQYKLFWNDQQIEHPKLFDLDSNLQVDNKYLVPNSFSGEISGSIPIVDNTPWESGRGVDKITFDESFLEVDAIANISVDNTQRMKIASKCVIGNDSTYLDSSNGQVSHRYRTLYNSPQTVDVKSIPYKISDNYLLIYDNLQKSDVLNYTENLKLSVAAYNYYVENNIINVHLEVNGTLDIENVKNSVRIYKEDHDILINCTTHDISTTDVVGGVSDNINLSIAVDDTLISENKFLFIKIRLDVDDEVILPIYTKMTESDKDEKLGRGFGDFTKLFIDELEGTVVDIPESAVTENGDSFPKYLTVYKDESGKKNVVHESNLEYYWYNNILKNETNTTDSIHKEYYFGKGTRASFNVNLTELGIKEGDVISIYGVEGESYEAMTVTAKNHEVFEKIGNSIYLKIDTLSTYNLQGYTVTMNGTNDREIYRRRYLVHHTTPPVTHSETDLDWVDKPIGEHAGWTGIRALEPKQLYVTKSAACNPNIQLSLASASPDSYNSDSNTFKKGSTLTNKSQINSKIYELVGNDKTKQLFSIVKAELDTNSSGFTLPMPKTPNGQHSLKWTKNKKNKGTDCAVVLTRESGGHAWKNKMREAIAYTGIVGGIAAVATMVVMGCVAAFGASAGAITAMATVAAASAAIPFVGWAILAAAVVAASIYLLVKLTEGEDQNFEFFVMKGPDNYPLVIPLWGTHVGYKGKSDRPWHTGKYEGIHPWYFDQDFHYCEELITYIATHIYYLDYVGKVNITALKDADNNNVTLSKTGLELVIKTASATTSSYGLDRYANILERVYPTNNFKVKDPSKGREFNYVESNVDNLIENDFDVLNQNLDYKTNSSQIYYYDSGDTPAEEGTPKWNIDQEFIAENNGFIHFLGGNGPDVHYDGDILTSDQSAFGGNGGGRRCKYKCHRKGLGMYKMIDGDYPLNNQGYTPVAYPVSGYSKDGVMVKDCGPWGYTDSDWGTSETTYRYGPNENDVRKSSKYYDYIKWDTYSNAFKLTCNTNEVQDKA